MRVMATPVDEGPSTFVKLKCIIALGLSRIIMICNLKLSI